MQIIDEATILHEIDPNWEQHLNLNEPLGKTILQHYMDIIDNPDQRNTSFDIAWSGLRSKLGGLRTQELTMLTGDTGHGKTTFALNLLYFAACQGHKSWMFSLEMGPMPIVKKIYQMECGKPPAWDSMAQDVESFGRWCGEHPIWLFNHADSIEYKKFRLYLAYAALKAECRLIFLDHFHLITTPYMDAAQLEWVAKDLRALAYKLNIAIVVIVHPAKIKGDAKERIIEMDELKGSSGLKQYADNVLSVFFDKSKKLNTLKLHKIRDDRYGRHMGDSLLYSLNLERLTFDECSL